VNAELAEVVWQRPASQRVFSFSFAVGLRTEDEDEDEGSISSPRQKKKKKRLGSNKGAKTFCRFWPRIQRIGQDTLQAGNLSISSYNCRDFFFVYRPVEGAVPHFHPRNRLSTNPHSSLFSLLSSATPGGLPPISKHRHHFSRKPGLKQMHKGPRGVSSKRSVVCKVCAEKTTPLVTPKMERRGKTREWKR
jgi:hypothetical protein